jgi:hypothetical protein
MDGKMRPLWKNLSLRLGQTKVLLGRVLVSSTLQAATFWLY